ncbi:MAG TPA: hypothetical protein VLA97_15565 [Nocardioidaceae bacterium]|nr:hypothetical protein [Nocardioidaceae bacterium]
MSAAPQNPASTRPVEQFRPTSGRILGVASLVVVAGLLLYLLLEERTLTGLRIGLGLVFLAVLVWATQLRPRAAAYPHALHLRNSFRDTTIPLAAIDEVSVRRTLNVWVGDQRYVCIGIGRSMRSMARMKSPGPASLLGFDRLESYREGSTPALPDQSAMDYETFVVTRIEGLAEDARRRGTTDQPPRHAWAWPEIVAVAATGTAFAASLLV